MKNNWLNEYAKDNFYSQYGEDGIISKILDILPDKNSWCVEFGAWDGVYCSTTLKLRKQSYNAVLIEGDKDKFLELEETCKNEFNSIPINCFVEPRGVNSLHSILVKTLIPMNFDLLVIDIDGDDYNVWKYLETYRPKLVCIECNPSFPDDVEFIQNENESNQGTSLSAMVELALYKEYELVSTLGGNAFFVDKKYYSIFNINDNSLHNIREWYGSIICIAQTYKGEIYTYGPNKLIWNNNKLVNYELSQLQNLCQKALRLNGIRYILFRVFTILRNKIADL